MRELPSRRFWLHAGLAAVLLAVGLIAYLRATALRYDFHHFYRDARYVWVHGELNPDLDGAVPEDRRQLPFYLPVVPLALAPLTMLGVKPAAVAWAAGQIAALWYCLSVLAVWCKPEQERQWPGVALAIACALALPAIYEAARFNQLSFVLLALILGGIAALERNQPGWAGLWLGLATVLKLLPAVFGVWLILKRQWAALSIYVATCLAATLLPCLIVFGPERTADYQRQWWEHNLERATARGAALEREHFIDHRNQAVSMVVERLFRDDHPFRVPWQPAMLGEQARRYLAWGLAALLLVGWLWGIRRPAKSLDLGGLHREVALGALAMIILSPLLRQYYLIWAFPMLCLFTRLATTTTVDRTRALGRIGLCVWSVGMAAWLSETARAYGVHLVMLIVLAALVLRLPASRALGAKDDATHRNA